MDDLYQIGCIGLIRASREYKLELGYKFSTLAVICIKREIEKHHKKDAAQKRKGQTLRLDKEMTDDGGILANAVPAKTSVEDEVIARETKRTLLKEEPVIIDMYLKGYTQKEIAARLGVSQSLIFKRINKLRSDVICQAH